MSKKKKAAFKNVKKKTTSTKQSPAEISLKKLLDLINDAESLHAVNNKSFEEHKKPVIDYLKKLAKDKEQFKEIVTMKKVWMKVAREDAPNLNNNDVNCRTELLFDDGNSYIGKKRVNDAQDLFTMLMKQTCIPKNKRISAEVMDFMLGAMPKHNFNQVEDNNLSPVVEYFRYYNQHDKNKELSTKLSTITKKLIDRDGLKSGKIHLPDRSDYINWSTLEMMADSKDRYELLKHMIDKGHDLNQEWGVFRMTLYIPKATPLMLFSYLGDIKAVKMLIEAGADVNKRLLDDALNVCKKQLYTKNEEYNALSFVTNIGVAKLLLKAGSDFICFRSLNADCDENLPLSKEAEEARQKDFKKFVIIRKLLILKNKIDSVLTKIESSSEKDDIISKSEDDKSAASENYEVSIDKEESLDDLLAQYFDKQDPILENKIRELCLENEEVKLQLVSTLNSQYIECDKADELITEVIYDHKFIHEYFTNRKKIIKHQLERELTEKSSDDSFKWNIDGQNIYESQVIPVNTNMRSNLYVKIDDVCGVDIQKGLSNLSMIKSDSRGKYGLKNRKDKGLYVLKTTISDDYRFVAQDIYKNDNSDMLIIFKHKYTHDDIENHKKGNKLPPIKPLHDSIVSEEILFSEHIGDVGDVDVSGKDVNDIETEH